MDGQRQEREHRFDALVGPHFDALYRAAMRLTRCREDAEDLVQEVALRAFAELERIAALDSPRAWLLRIQYHLFVDSARRRARSPVVADAGGAAGRAESGAPGPEEMAESSHRQQQLAAAWAQLSRRQRALLGLHAEGYSLAELADITGLSRNALGVRLHRARARLAGLMRSEPANELRLVRLEG